MDKRICIGFLFSLFAITVFSQTEAPNDSIKLLVPAVPESRSPVHTDDSGFILPDATPDSHHASPVAADSMTMRIIIPEFVRTPWPKPRLGQDSNPWARDYNRYDNFILTPNSYISTYSTYNTYPTMGTHIDVGAAYTYQFNERWDVTGGIYTTKYTMPSFVHGSQFDAGFNGSFGYRINDWLKIRAVGQYSINGQRNAAHGYLTPMAPQSYYGVIMELKVTNWLELHGGMERVYDPMKMKGKTVPIAYPVFKIGGK